MSAEQLEIHWQAPAPDEVRMHARLIELHEILKQNGGWMTRRTLEGLGFDERELRLLGEQDADGILFSFPGSPGYKHFDLVTDEEFDRCGALKAQVRKMLRKWTRFQRRWHRRHKSA